MRDQRDEAQANSGNHQSAHDVEIAAAARITGPEIDRLICAQLISIGFALANHHSPVPEIEHVLSSEIDEQPELGVEGPAVIGPEELEPTLQHSRTGDFLHVVRS